MSHTVNSTHIYYDEGIYNVTLQVGDKKVQKEMVKINGKLKKLHY